MFHNILGTSHINNWISYQSNNAENIPTSRTNPIYKVNNLLNDEAKKEHNTSEKGHIMKTIITPSQVSPADSLDSVGSVALSSIDNSSSEIIDDKEVMKIR